MIHHRLVLLALLSGHAGALRFQRRGPALTMPGQCTLKHQPHQNPHNFADFKHGSGYQGLYVNPANKFAFCTIEKNACSQWTAILKKLETGRLDQDGASYQVTHKAFTPEKAQQVFSDPKATRAVFVRDPIERFLSAFLDKCFDLMCTNPFCSPREDMKNHGPDMTGQEISLKTATDWMLRRDPHFLDGHWKLQSAHCELKDRIQEYTHIGFMSESTLSEQATCLLNEAELSFLNVRNIGQGEDMERPFWDTTKSENAFKQKISSAEEATEYMKKFFTKEAAEKLYQKLHEDYETFGLPRPAWIDEATGELYAKTRTTSARCKGDGSALKHKMSFTQVLSESVTKDDVDGIADLAERAGFYLENYK